MHLTIKLVSRFQIRHRDKSHYHGVYFLASIAPPAIHVTLNCCQASSFTGSKNHTLERLKPHLALSAERPLMNRPKQGRAGLRYRPQFETPRRRLLTAFAMVSMAGPHRLFPASAPSRP